MPEQAAFTGQCLCSAVSVTATPTALTMGACHCGMCRRWGGGPFMTVDCGSGVSIQGEQNVGVFDSSDWAQRGFCKSCGTHLYYRLKGNSQYFIPAGLLAGAGEFAFDHQVFIDEKPGNYSFSNTTKDMTGPELFAMFAPEPE